MDDIVWKATESERVTVGWHVEIMSRAALRSCAHWPSAFARERKDHRYFEIVEDTIQPDFDFSYFAIKDASGSVRAIQPFFVLDQDLLVGMSPRVDFATRFVRRLWPRFMKVRTLMVGCAAGEGHLDGPEAAQQQYARVLARDLASRARALKAPMIVLKEFPAKYRSALQHFWPRDIPASQACR